MIASTTTTTTAPPSAHSIAPPAAVRNGQHPPTPAPALGVVERIGAYAVVVLAALLGAIGAVNSFQRVEAAVAPSFGRLAWTVPLGIDIGIAVFTGLDLVMARLGMRLAWLRLVPWALVVTTIYLNVAEEHTAIGIVAHAVLPGLWVIAVEVGAHMVRSWAGITGTAPQRRRRLDRVRLSRWVLAPVSTARLRRRMILCEIVSYPDALAWDRARRLAKSELQDTYGRIAWRWQAPRRARLDYKLGELRPTRTPTDTTAAGEPERKALPPAPRRRARSTKATAAGARPKGNVADTVLLAAGRRVAARLNREGKALTRRALVERLRSEEGLAIGTQRATMLLAQLRDEAATTPQAPPAATDQAPPADGDDAGAGEGS